MAQCLLSMCDALGLILRTTRGKKGKIEYLVYIQIASCVPKKTVPGPWPWAEPDQGFRLDTVTFLHV